MSRIANYCPACGASLEERLIANKLRPVCSSDECGGILYFDPKVAVVIFIVQDEKVLLIQRKIDPGQGKWACPAGFVDHDEAPMDAAKREVLEETGYHIEIVHLLDVFPKKDHGLADIVIAYQASIIGGELEAGDDAIDANWFGKDELPELVFYPSITLTERWKQGQLVD